MMVEHMAMVAMVLAGVLLISFLMLFYASGRSKRSVVSNASHVKGSNRYTVAEVKKHNSRHDCWIIIKDKVYDVTSYVEEHPGGDSILNNAGGDSTEGFYGPQHVSRVFEMIGDYCIGDLQP